MSATGSSIHPPHDHLIVMTRWPEPGKTKTRMIDTLGPNGAADLQRNMTRHMLGWAWQWAQGKNRCVEVRFAGGDAQRMQHSFGTTFPYVRQAEGDLGHRMHRAVCDAFEQGARRVVVIGSDCPTLTPPTLEAAFERLTHHDAVIAPAQDGGYVLIGMQRPMPELFQGPAWGTEQVLDQTLRAAKSASIDIATLPTHCDIDRPDDLAAWHSAAQSSPPKLSPSLSVIVPTRNEAQHLSATLAALTQASDVQLIVADGQSSDETIRIATEAGAEVIAAPIGRAAQMNAGARAATGELLLFCHADTLMPPHYDQHIRNTLSVPDVVAGAFRFKLDLPGAGARRIERGVARRCDRKQLPYGDQGLFVRAETFEQMGGFPDQLIMEDYELVRRLQHKGQIALADADAVTSGRYWAACGLWRTTFINWVTLAGYRAGIGHARLKRWRNGWLERAAGRRSH